MDQTLDDNTLNPLEWFHHAPGETPPSFDAVAGPELPEPYRGLLVHERDMTSTLEAFVGQPLVLRVLRVHRSADCLHREVVLVGASDGTMAEFGAIRIFEPSRFNFLDCIYAANFNVSGCPRGEVDAQAIFLTISK